MSAVTSHPINAKWPASDPSVLQLYAFPTPNGVKVSIMLEETGLPYEAHLVGLSDDYVKSPEFLSLSPNNKIPAIIDPNGPDGDPVYLFESGAILIYLAEKTGQLIGTNAAEKAEIIQWLMWQMGGLGPMLGQMGFFYKFAGSTWEDKRPQARYVDESKRLLAVLEKQLEGKEWVTGTYSIADIAIAPWLGAIDFYGAKEVLGLAELPNITAYMARFGARPAVQKGRGVPPIPK